MMGLFLIVFSKTIIRRVRIIMWGRKALQLTSAFINLPLIYPNSMLKFTNAFRVLSLALFLVSLIYAYAAIPGAINFGGPVLFDLLPEEISKVAFFFGILVLASSINLIGLAFIRAYRNRWIIASKGSALNLRQLPAWLNGFLGLVNLLLITGIFYIGFTNSAEEVTIGNFTLVIAAVPVLLVIWVIYLPFLLRKQED